MALKQLKELQQHQRFQVGKQVYAVDYHEPQGKTVAYNVRSGARQAFNSYWKVAETGSALR